MAAETLERVTLSEAAGIPLPAGELRLSAGASGPRVGTLGDREVELLRVAPGHESAARRLVALGAAGVGGVVAGGVTADGELVVVRRRPLRTASDLAAGERLPPARALALTRQFALALATLEEASLSAGTLRPSRLRTRRRWLARRRRPRSRSPRPGSDNHHGNTTLAAVDAARAGRRRVVERGSQPLRPRAHCLPALSWRTSVLGRWPKARARHPRAAPLRRERPKHPAPRRSGLRPLAPSSQRRTAPSERAARAQGRRDVTRPRRHRAGGRSARAASRDAGARATVGTAIAAIGGARTARASTARCLVPQRSDAYPLRQRRRSARGLVVCAARRCASGALARRDAFTNRRPLGANMCPVPRERGRRVASLGDGVRRQESAVPGTRECG